MGNLTFAAGDVIIVNDKSSISIDSNRVIINENTPYIIEHILSEEDGFYIDIYGKYIRIFESDYRYIEHIPIGDRIDDGVVEVNLWDTVKIIDDEFIEGAQNYGFRNGLTFEVSKVVPDGSIIIKNNNKELWIKKEEFRFITVNKKKPTDEMRRNLQLNIDKALDNRSFDELKFILKAKREIEGLE